MPTEAAREREAFRYDSSLLSKSVVTESLQGPDPAALSSSEDPSLSAFAQLGALRLGGRRCMISIFDRTYQHIIAESTATTTLAPNEHQTADSLMLCGTAFPRSYGVCEHVLLMSSPIADSLTPPESGDSFSGTQEPGTLPVSVVPDLWADSRFDGKPYVGRGCGALRFYVGTPIQTRRGINIGVYSVMGEEPRDSIDPTLTHFLRDMSRTVMAYLEHRVSATSYRRNVRMVRGLGSLVEGQGSMSNWWLDRNPSSFTTHGDEGALNSKQQVLQLGNSGPAPQVRPQAQPMQISSQPETPTGSETPLTQSDNRTGSSDYLGARQSSMSATAHTSSLVHDREDESTSQLQDLFSRAANLAREAVEVEGALFLDAAVGSFGGLATQEDVGRENSSENSGSTPSSAEETRSRHSPGSTDSNMCKILGFSQSDTSSIDGDLASAVHSVIPEHFLRSVLRRYPDGTIFHFDENGGLQSGDSEEDLVITSAEVTLAEEVARPQRKKPHWRRSDRDILTKAFAGARSIVVVPLWDSHKERWYAGGFVWTRTPTRIFTREGELSYLKALGIIVMAQVSRINALRADKAKADVLGSLSHEIRSPLHGVVLGIELLHDTDLSGFQEDLIHTVETCSRTLMETMDHLLDFSKINYFTKQAKKNRTASPSRAVYNHTDASKELGMMSLFTDVRMDTLVEEVIESIFAGHSFYQNSGSWKTTTRHVNTGFGQSGALRRILSIKSPMDDERSSWPGGGMKQRPPVTIYLDIEHGLSWNFHTQPGAIRRTIMNLFGNALKYTTQGSIVISLTQESPAPAAKGRKRRVVFSISDSGKGISADYLRNHLFTPFSQENHLAPGTGLGMSLVKQIVHSLKGEIGVESQVGRGTMVKVILPLVPSRLSSGPNTTPTEKDFSTQVDSLRGQKVCLVGFKDVADADYPLIDTASLPPNPKALMDNICQTWLGMEGVSINDVSSTPPSVYIVTQDSMSSLPHLANPGSNAIPVLVICHHALAAHELTMGHNASPHLAFISQPPGHRKLAKVLCNVLSSSQARAQLPGSADSSGGSATPRPTDHNQLFSDSAHLAPEKDSARATPSTRTRPHLNHTSDVTTQRGAIPTQPSAATPPRSPTEAPAEDQEKHNCFLLVDDNAINLKILSAYMRKLKRCFDTAENGLEAVEAYRQNPEKYCGIFMDISMPIMDGLEATRSIRIHEQQHGLPQTMVVALTGLASVDTQKDAFASGVNLFMTKPVPLKQLSRVIETHKL